MENKLAVVLISISGCKKQNWNILDKILEDDIDIFCAVEVECTLWEDIMDETIVGDGSIEREKHIVTTSHPGESIDDVKEFATNFFPKDKVTIRVVEI